MGQSTPPRRIAVVVEDDEYQRELAAVLLEESDLKVIQCDTAEAAERAVKEHSDAVSLLFTDVNLAGRMKGTELAARVVRRYPNVSVIITSAGATVTGIPSGAVFMPKPWRPLEILKHAERIAA